jgi:ABC-type cobalamin/Fe3+-siderophores transport system ATPase subunit
MINFNQIDLEIGKITLLKNTNLRLQKGCFYCFIGKNGSGKTTLFRHLKNQNDIDLKTRLLQQDSQTKSTYGITVWGYLKAFCIFERILEWEKKVNNYLTKFNLNEKREQLIGSLSGGEKQRMLLAQIFLGDSDLILLDESFSNLDISYKIKYFSLLREEAINRNIPIILIEHDIRLAIEYSERILLLLTQNGSLKVFLSNDRTLKEAIREEFSIIISDKNTYELDTLQNALIEA